MSSFFPGAVKIFLGKDDNPPQKKMACMQHAYDQQKRQTEGH